MVSHKAEIIEEEYVRRLFNETFDSMGEMSINSLAGLPESIRDAILHTAAIEIVACRLCRSARWN